jgi:hypothetical protein
MIKGIEHWDSFFTKEEYDKVDQELLNYEWTFGASANNNLLTSNIRQFWYKDLMKSEYIKELFKFGTEDFLKTEVESMRLYANGQSHGMTGYIHSDVPKEEPGICGSIVYFFHCFTYSRIVSIDHKQSRRLRVSPGISSSIKSIGSGNPNGAFKKSISLFFSYIKPLFAVFFYPV